LTKRYGARGNLVTILLTHATQGFQRETGARFWNIGCREQAYSVVLTGDPRGATKMLECNRFREVTGLSCFDQLTKIIVIR
jgi:hypothetical protein